MRGGRLSLDHPGFFQKCVTEMAYRLRQHGPLLVLGGEQDQLGQALRHIRRQPGKIDRFGPLDVLLHDLVDIAVKTIGHGGPALIAVKRPGLTVALKYCI